MNTKIFKKKIRTGCAIAEAQAKQVPLLEYSKRSNIIKDYMIFAEEIITGGADDGE